MDINDSLYRPRVVDETIEKYLKAFGAVEIAGTMWSGKTWTSMVHGSSRATLDERQTRELAQLDVSTVLQGAAPHIIDEWQEVPTVWDAVRNRVDEAAGSRGLFILTGSSRPARGLARHTGSGRIARVTMWPMSLAELGASHQSVSLAGLFDGEFAPSPVETSLETLATLICRGGWPAAIDLDDELALLLPDQYLDAFVSKDDERAPARPRELRRFLQSLARTTGSAVTLKPLALDMGWSEGGTVSDASTRRAREFLDYLLDRYLIADLDGWDAPIKSPSRLRTKPKHGFADPSLPASLLGMSPASLLDNLQVFGQLFEELCLRDLRVYVSALPQAKPDSLRYYRDADGLEVDAVIELRDGRWGAVEIKLGANKAPEAEHSLLRLRDKIAANAAACNPEPSFLLCLVGKTDFQYRLPSGVIVAPVTELTA